MTHVCREAFDQDGHEQVEQHVVAKRHQRYEVKRGPGRRARHAVIEHLVPVLLRQDLREESGHVKGKGSLVSYAIQIS